VNAPAGVAAHIVVRHVAVARFDEADAVLGTASGDARDACTKGLEKEHAPAIRLEDFPAQDLQTIR
jgi:hypothetical protein